MTREELTRLVNLRFKRSALPEATFSSNDTEIIESYFGCVLPEGFASMRDLIGIYRIEGDHMRATEIIAAFETEKAVNPLWSEDLIPFYSIGNGDYLCFRRSECPTSGVYFIPHDEQRITKLHESFDKYLQDQEWFY